MDSLDTCFADGFLDLPLDITELNPKLEDQQAEAEAEDNGDNLHEKATPFASQTDAHDASDVFFYTTDEAFPEFLEELEWLSNEDAFPTLETFDISVDKPSAGTKHQSPVSVLESSVGSCVGPKNQNPVSVLVTGEGAGSCGIGFPVRARSKRRRRRRGVSCFAGMWSQARMASQPPRRKCLHCLAEKTPQWRAGPLGPKTLCNACGVWYKSGRLVPEYRPASSPTFSSELHSNSYRKILEMRRLKQRANDRF
ncbi:GATA transcription factor 1-like [Aristolochia californica]|uniref:GATA transcription factor 1-like n=1 Tax=Aristolochia californica TaxID=171875 RepID=UPI0035D56E88